MIGDATASSDAAIGAKRPMSDPKAIAATAPRLVTATEFVADAVRADILSGRLAAGEPLKQDHIASRLGVSQGTVREALRRLESMALVTWSRNRGAVVSGLSSAQVEEMYDLRVAIELVALRAGFAHLAPERLAAAQEILDDMQARGQTSLMGDPHKEFHALFYVHPRRTMSGEFLQTIYGNLTRVWVDFMNKHPDLANAYEVVSQREHHLLLEAVVAGDLPGAERILQAHIWAARDLLVNHARSEERATVPSAPPSSAANDYAVDQLAADAET